MYETPTTATVDGDAGLGLVVAPFAMKVAIEKAEKYGSGWVSVRNSNHFGIAAYHTMMAVEKDMIGLEVYDDEGLTKVVATKSNGLKKVLRLHNSYRQKQRNQEKLNTHQY